MAREDDSSKVEEANTDQADVENTELEAEVEDSEVADTEDVPDGELDDDSEDSLEEQLVAALTTIERQKEDVLRAHAEVQNMRRRAEKDVESAHKFALERFSGELLPIIDNLERALQSVPQDQEQDDCLKTVCEGVDLTIKSFVETLKKFNIAQLDPLGEPFDPQFHQAMSMQENPDVEPNTVTAVMQKGYTLNGRVLRPAMVMVSKANHQSSPTIDEKA